MAGPAGVLQMAKPVAVLAQIEGFAGLSIVVALATPVTCVELDARVVCLGVIKGGVAGIDFIGTYKVGGGVLKDHLWGNLIVGIGTRESSYAVVVVFLELKEFLLHFCDVVGRAVDAGIEGTVAHDFGTEGVVLFQVNGVVNQLGKGLVGVKCKLLFAGQCSTGVGVSVGIEGMGVDSTIASMSKEEFGRLSVEVVLVKGGDYFNLTIEDQVGEGRGVVGFVVVDEPPNF